MVKTSIQEDYNLLLRDHLTNEQIIDHLRRQVARFQGSDTSVSGGDRTRDSAGKDQEDCREEPAVVGSQRNSQDMQNSGERDQQNQHEDPSSSPQCPTNAVMSPQASENSCEISGPLLPLPDVNPHQAGKCPCSDGESSDAAGAGHHRQVMGEDHTQPESVRGHLGSAGTSSIPDEVDHELSIVQAQDVDQSDVCSTSGTTAVVVWSGTDQPAVLEPPTSAADDETQLTIGTRASIAGDRSRCGVQEADINGQRRDDSAERMIPRIDTTYMLQRHDSRSSTTTALATPTRGSMGSCTSLMVDQRPRLSGAAFLGSASPGTLSRPPIPPARKMLRTPTPDTETRGLKAEMRSTGRLASAERRVLSSPRPQEREFDLGHRGGSRSGTPMVSRASPPPEVRGFLTAGDAVRPARQPSPVWVGWERSITSPSCSPLIGPRQIHGSLGILSSPAPLPSAPTQRGGRGGPEPFVRLDSPRCRIAQHDRGPSPTTRLAPGLGGQMTPSGYGRSACVVSCNDLLRSPSTGTRAVNSVVRSSPPRAGSQHRYGTPLAGYGSPDQRSLRSHGAITVPSSTPQQYRASMLDQKEVGDRLAQGTATIYSPGRGRSPTRPQVGDGRRLSLRPVPPAPLAGSPTITTRLTRPAHGVGAREIWAPVGDAGAQTPVLRSFEGKVAGGSAVHRVHESRGLCVVGARDGLRGVHPPPPSVGHGCVSTARQPLAAGQSARTYAQAPPQALDPRRQWNQHL